MYMYTTFILKAPFTFAISTLTKTLKIHTERHKLALLGWVF